MKKTLLMVGALLALTAGIASAQGGINLSWNDCGAGGVLQKNFACTSNSGAATMFASAVSGVQMDQLNGQASVLDLQTNQATLSPWWQFGGCRLLTNLSAGFNFVSGPASCLDVWAGQAAGGIDYTPGYGGANKARIRTVCAIPGSTPITGTDEYAYFSVTYTYARSTGTGSCAGCTDGACIVFNSILLTQPVGVGDYTIANPLERNFVLWQGGASGVTGGCPAATPTRTKTWGQVKSLYR